MLVTAFMVSHFSGDNIVADAYDSSVFYLGTRHKVCQILLLLIIHLIPGRCVYNVQSILHILAVLLKLLSQAIGWDTVW